MVEYTYQLNCGELKRGRNTHKLSNNILEQLINADYHDFKSLAFCQPYNCIIKDYLTGENDIRKNCDINIFCQKPYVVAKNIKDKGCFKYITFTFSR